MLTDGKLKSLSFSYDDGVSSDKKLLQILNKYGMKGTFNLNTGRHPSRSTGEQITWMCKGIPITHFWREELPEIYAGHEVAIHSLNHLRLETLTRNECQYQIEADIENMTQIFGKRPVGMAYPYGTYNNMVVDIVQNNDIRYSRTVDVTGEFEPEVDLLRLRTTCHHKDPRLMDLARQFVQMTADSPQRFIVWGHSFEFEGDRNWSVLEEFCEYMSCRDDVFYGTNAEILLESYRGG